MSFNIFTMKSLFSWALKSQASRKSLQPVQLSRLFSDVTGRAVEEEERPQSREDDEESDAFKRTSPKHHTVERSINEVRLLGRIGKDPVIFEGKKKPYVIFPLATSSSNWDKETGQYNEVTEWHTIVNYSPQKIDTITRYLRRGHRVYVFGKLVYSAGTGMEKSCRVILNDFISIYG